MSRKWQMKPQTPERRCVVRGGNEDDIVTACSCMSQVRDVTPEDTWKGHLCTAEMRRFKPLSSGLP